MPRNSYSQEFKKDAVLLYETHPELSYSEAAADLGIGRGTLKTWVAKARRAEGRLPSTPAGKGKESVDEELARLRSENQALREREKDLVQRNKVLAEEREILRKATKYFAAETTW